jgi:membrane-associated phospholipid phosphatase
MHDPTRSRTEHEPAGRVVVIRQHRALVEFAKALSTIFNPFVSAAILFVIVSHAYSKTTLEFWTLSVTTVFAFTVLPLISVLYLYVSGRISDFEMTDRYERERVFFIFVIIYLIAAVALTLAGVKQPLVAMAWGYWGTALGTMIITRYWKISTHAFGITGPFAVLIALFHEIPLPYIALVPLVCWSRIYLRAHTVAQVLAGAGLAIASTILFFKLFHII